MGCCKCEEYEWRVPQQTVWRGNGLEFCVFHAPKDEKWKPGGAELYTREEFGALVSGFIEEAGEVGEICNLRGAVFPWEYSFSEISFEMLEIDLREALFIGDVYFDECILKGIFVSNANFCKDIKIIESKLCGGIDFSNAKYFGNVIFYKVCFGGMANIRGIKIENNKHISLHSIDKISFEKLRFAREELPHIKFVLCRWPDALGLEKFGTMNRDNLLACEELYRAMKQHAAEEHDQPQVSRWHFREKFMQLKQMLANERSNDLIEVVEDHDAKWGDRAKAWFKLLWHRPHWPKFTLTGLYWATSGFGERAVRAGVMLAVLIALSFTANSITEPWVWSELPGSAAARYTMATIPFAKDIPGDGWVKVGRGLWQLLIAIQFTLFALAVRNRFRR